VRKNMPGEFVNTERIQETNMSIIKRDKEA
jgi:hypothetical protein